MKRLRITTGVFNFLVQIPNTKMHMKSKLEIEGTIPNSDIWKVIMLRSHTTRLLGCRVANILRPRVLNK